MSIKPSEYLISRGWLPSPSTRVASAWEHAELAFEWPEGFCEPTPIRVNVEWAVERQLEEDEHHEHRRNAYFQYCSVFGGP